MVLVFRPMSASKPPATPPAPAPKRPFAPPIEGELRDRLSKYAIERGRSMAGAARWALHVGLKQEGF